VLAHLENILFALAPGYNADNTNDLFTGLLTLRIGRFRETLCEAFRPIAERRSFRSSGAVFAALLSRCQKPATRSVDESLRIRFFDHDIKAERS
jgi:hypothetical protein